MNAHITTVWIHGEDDRKLQVFIDGFRKEIIRRQHEMIEISIISKYLGADCENFSNTPRVLGNDFRSLFKKKKRNRVRFFLKRKISVRLLWRNFRPWWNSGSFGIIHRRRTDGLERPRNNNGTGYIIQVANYRKHNAEE